MRWLAAALCVVLTAVTFAGCGGGDSGSTGGGTDGGDTAVTGSADDVAAIIEQATQNLADVEADYGNDATSSKDTLTFAAIADPGKISLDNLMDLTTYPLAMAAVEYFVRYDYKKGGFFSPVCDSFELDEDELGVTFHITPGIMMHDGEEFTAEDVIASIEAFQKDSGLGWQMDFADTANSNIIDDYTVDIRFKNKNGVWESSFMMFNCISKKSYDEMGADAFYQEPFGPAPYHLTEYVPGDHITFEAFEDYYRGTPKIKYITMKIVSDDTASFMELQNGDIDLVWNVNADQVKSAAGNPDLKLLLLDKVIINWIGMNCSNEALGKKEVREAIWYAVNRDDINLGAYDGLADPAPSILTANAIGYDPQYETNPPIVPNIEKAKELMKEAGYENGLTLKMIGETTTNYQLVAEQLSAMLAEIGITVEINLSDYATANSIMYGGDDSAWDILIFNNLTSDEAISYLDNPMLYGSCKWEKASDGSGAGFQEILNNIRNTADYEAREQLYKDLQAYFFEDGLYWIPLNTAQTYVAVSKDLTGLDRRGHLMAFDKAYFE